MKNVSIMKDDFALFDDVTQSCLASEGRGKYLLPLSPSLVGRYPRSKACQYNFLALQQPNTCF